MATEPKGAYNRAPTFISENYGYWKACMHIHINSIDKGLWDAIINDPNKITMTNGKGVIVPKKEGQWNDNDRMLWSHDCKAQNILIYALGVNEYYRVSHCETSKAIWECIISFP